MVDKLKILHDLKNQLSINLGTELQDVILFGSQVSGLVSIDSDYDFLIILQNKPDWKLKKIISDICYTIDLKYDIISDTHILSKSEQNTLRWKQPIFRKALNDGIYA
jgi:predicted nucleotidyltransferase